MFDFKILITAVFVMTVLSSFMAYAQDDMVRIPATGDTVTGYKGCSFTNMSCKESDVESVTIKAFYIDKHEMTYNNTLEPYLAVYHIAKTTCESMGKRLPTEEEWLAAAMQDGIQNYTWGNEYISTAAAPSILVSNASDNHQIMQHPMDYTHGLYDMSGNGCEWVYVEDNKIEVSCDLYYVTPRYCMGAAPLPLYQQVYPMRTEDYNSDLNVAGLASFRCVKDIDDI